MLAGSSPLFVLLYYWTFRRVSPEVFEMARLDGASPLGTWRRIALPLAVPHGTLIVNANSVMHLNPSATFMAWMILEGKSDAEIVRSISQKWKVGSGQLAEDLSTFHFQLSNLLRPDGACAIHDLEIESLMPFSARPSAPYRMDLAVTYRCNNDCAHCYNARERHFPELTTQQWFAVIDKCFDLGVPHIVFTGGEATLRNDLPALIQHAENNGQITGLNTNARRLMDMDYVNQLKLNRAYQYDSTKGAEAASKRHASGGGKSLPSKRRKPVL